MALIEGETACIEQVGTSLSSGCQLAEWWASWYSSETRDNSVTDAGALVSKIRGLEGPVAMWKEPEQGRKCVPAAWSYAAQQEKEQASQQESQQERSPCPCQEWLLWLRKCHVKGHKTRRPCGVTRGANSVQMTRGRVDTATWLSEPCLSSRPTRL